MPYICKITLRIVKPIEFLKSNTFLIYYYQSNYFMRMRHLLLRWATCVTLLTCLAFAARADADFIYIFGNDGGPYYMPCTDNAAYFEDYKLYETSPGSKVYEGNFYFHSNSYFHFIYELPEAVNVDDYSVYRQNLIQPAADGARLDRIGKTGVYSSRDVVVETMVRNGEGPRNWVANENPANCRVVVDLNVNKIFLIDDGMESWLVVPEGMPAPTLDNVTDYKAAGGYKEYIPAGRLAFSYYSLSDGKWRCNNTTDELVNGVNYVYLSEQPERGYDYVKSDWKGGVVSMPPSVSPVVLSEDSGEAEAQDAIYVHRSTDSFTPWAGASSEVMSSFDVLKPDGEGNYTGLVTVASGEKFNFISALAATQDANTVICPPADRAIHFNEFSGQYHSSAVTAAQSEGAYWVAPEMSCSNQYTITVTPGEKPVVKIEGEKSALEIYIIGIPQGWGVGDGSMPLKRTVNGGYYGAYDIKAGEAMFRFYTSLGDWEVGSLGSQYEDMPKEYGTVEQEQVCSLVVDGKGSFQFSDWPGGMIYMYVEPSASRVTFSPSPIAAAGEYLDDAEIDPKGLKSLYDEDGDELDGRDGVYSMSLFVSGDETEVVKLYTYNLPMSRDEAEAEGSYALTLPDGFEWEFDEMGVAEATYTVQEGVTTAVPNHITVTNSEGVASQQYNLCIDTNTHKIYLERIGTAWHLIGSSTGIKTPTYADRADFRESAFVKCGLIMDVPAGKLDFVWANSIATAMAVADGSLSLDYNTTEVNMTEGVAISSMWNSSGAYNVKVAEEWPGGRLFVTPDYIMDARDMSQIYGVMLGDADAYIKTSVLTETAPGSMIYEGEVAFEDATNPLLWFTLDEFRRVRITYVDSPELAAKNGVMSSNLSYSTYNGHFEVHGVKGNGSLKATVDLNRMTMRAEVAADNMATVYEVVSDNSSINHVFASESAELADALCLYVDMAGTSARFNFASEGEIIVPASGSSTAIQPGADGVWEGGFVKVSVPEHDMDAARQDAASSAAKWSLSLPEGAESSAVAMLINEATGKLKLFSSAHKTDGFFILTESPYFSGVWPTIENIDNLAKMVKVADGRYEAEVTVPEAGIRNMLIIKSTAKKSTMPLLGLASDIGGGTSLFSLDEDGDEMSLPAWPSDQSYVTSWTVNAPAGKAIVTYDEKAHKLTVKSDAGLGVDDLTADSGTSFRIEVGDGCVTVVSDGDMDLDFVNATGAVAKSVSVAAGTTTVGLAPGFYIVAGQKIFVR